MATIWIDVSSGASGDMLLGALVDAGVPLETLQTAIDAVVPEPVTLRAEQVTRHGFPATKVNVDGVDSVASRTWADIEPVLTGRALDTFRRLAEAEAAVHGLPISEVHFHEVGALDAIADVVGVCAGLDHLGADSVVVSRIALGGGSVETEHGRLAVPAPAVARLLVGVPTVGGPIERELCTPTGAALLVANATGWGDQPAMTTTAIGVGAGGLDPAGHANVLRLFVGDPASTMAKPVLLETNVDDLDPRLWPTVLASLLEAGASDAWLTPILMKKGRPAHTLSVLAGTDRAEACRRVIFRETTAIGVRETLVDGKHALDRSIRTVVVDGHSIDVKLASLGGEVVNVQPEYEHVAAAARALGLPTKTVLRRAIAAAEGER